MIIIVSGKCLKNRKTFLSLLKNISGVEIFDSREKMDQSCAEIKILHGDFLLKSQRTGAKILIFLREENDGYDFSSNEAEYVFSCFPRKTLEVAERLKNFLSQNPQF